MCKFFSGIAFKNGDIYYNPMTDSHEDLVAEKELDDTVVLSSVKRNWVRFEYTSDNLADLKTYMLKIDESSSPTWCDKEFLENLEDKSKNIVKAMILHKVEKKILVGGCWLLTGGSIIDKVVNVRIILLESSSVKQMRGSSSVKQMWGSSSVNEMWESSSVNEMRESSSVNEMRESSSVNEMRESSSVNEMLGSSSVNEMRESSSVKQMWGSSSVKQMRGSSSVNEMWGSSSVNEMRESSSVKQMLESSSVKQMWGSSSVNEMLESSSVNEMLESSKILADNRINKSLAKEMR